MYANPYFLKENLIMKTVFNNGKGFYILWRQVFNESEFKTLRANEVCKK